jgi:hypothetical protein
MEHLPQQRYLFALSNSQEVRLTIFSLWSQLLLLALLLLLVMMSEGPRLHQP